MNDFENEMQKFSPQSEPTTYTPKGEPVYDWSANQLCPFFQTGCKMDNCLAFKWTKKPEPFPKIGWPTAVLPGMYGFCSVLDRLMPFSKP